MLQSDWQTPTGKETGTETEVTLMARYFGYSGYYRYFGYLSYS